MSPIPRLIIYSFNIVVKCYSMLFEIKPNTLKQMYNYIEVVFC